MNRPFWPSALRRSAQCAYASNSSRMARRSAASAAVISVCPVISDFPQSRTYKWADAMEVRLPVRHWRPDSHTRMLAMLAGGLARHLASYDLFMARR
jgi:hypothetical protein